MKSSLRYLILTLFVVAATGARGASVDGEAGCQNDLGDPLSRASLVQDGHLSEQEAWTADIRNVTITYPRPGRLGRLTSRWRRQEIKGVLVTDSNGRALVFRRSEARHELFSPWRHPEAAVWDGQKRRLSAVEGAWHWEGAPPPPREVSELTLTQFLESFGEALEPLLNDGELTEADVLDGLLQTVSGAKGGPYVLLEVPTPGAAPSRVYVFARDPSPRWAKDFVANLARGARVDVGRGGRRLYQRFRADGSPTAEPGWAPAPGVAHGLVDKAEDPAWRKFLTERSDAVDELMLHPLAPSLAQLSEGKLVDGTDERTGEKVRVLLTPIFGASEPTYDPLPWTDAHGWFWPGEPAPGVGFRLGDGRRFGVRQDRGGFRWLGRADALERLRRAARGR